METLLDLLLLTAAAWWLYHQGKRIGSRQGYGAGRARARRRRPRR
ncbi:hypothetical protein [Lignipirellula cremea]|uniref:Uncharacterized protein n=1 Tax=Lignipirellula cremea TaxID=2528010 RepID=A0A518DKG9_9BACT|nr:hypothetical protein [Lignipirellula cremea]QDU92332.1 hypothetical protein Pla8534_00770 [Lignipirellula cremea]